MKVKTRAIAALAAVVCLCACLLALPGCSSGDQKMLQGTWQVEGTDVTVVFTDTEFKMVGNTFTYTMDSGAKTINYKSGDIDFGSAQYSFEDNGKKLTLREDDGNGGTKTTNFDKVSDDTSGEPSVGGVTDDETDDGSSEQQ